MIGFPGLLTVLTARPNSTNRTTLGTGVADDKSLTLRPEMIRSSSAKPPIHRQTWTHHGFCARPETRITWLATDPSSRQRRSTAPRLMGMLIGPAAKRS